MMLSTLFFQSRGIWFSVAPPILMMLMRICWYNPITKEFRELV
jgi:hypothetical protein